MIFGKNNGKQIEVPASNSNTFSPPDETNGGYTFIEVYQITELEAYEYYRKTKVKLDAKKLQKPTHSIRLAPTIPPTPQPMLATFGQLVKVQNASSCPIDIDKLDIFIIPKLYQYFAFLDCDNEAMYNETIALLDTDKISWISYKSTPSKNSFWVFCDKFGTFDEVLSFIERYPADPRYAWVAGHKREFCIRGIPRLNQVPQKYQTNGTLSSGLQFWISEFDEYWKGGKLIEYINFNMVGENV